MRQDVWRTWSLRRRLLATFALVLTGVLVVGVAAFAVSLNRILAASARDTARTQASELVDLVGSGALTAQEAVTQQRSQGAVLQLRSSDGRLVATSEPAFATVITEARPAVGSIVTEELDEAGPDDASYVVAAAGARDASGTAYTLIVGRPLATESRSVWVATGLLAVGAFSLAGALLVIVARVVTAALRPVDDIRREVSRITSVGSPDRVTVPVAQDEIAQLARTMNVMLDRLARADAASRQFVSDASHELRSPLATIRATLETAPVDERETPDARLLHAEVVRMQALVDDLLTLARADDAQGLRLRNDEVDLDDLVFREVHRLRTSTRLTVSADIAPARVIGDAGRLAQVLRNLTDNAVRHARSAVRLEVAQVGHEAWVHVDNDGSSIAPQDRERVFERFTRLDESRVRDRGGSGLGLAIARTLARAHGGDVEALEEPGGGCRFSVHLPAQTPEA